VPAQVLDQAASLGLPLHKVTLGLPFYGRFVEGGDWRSYEDIVQQHHPLDPAADAVMDSPYGRDDANALKGRPVGLAFNGYDTIKAKTTRALARGLGGVMVWEAGQDCRLGCVARAVWTPPFNARRAAQCLIAVRPCVLQGGRARGRDAARRHLPQRRGRLAT